MHSLCFDGEKNARIVVPPLLLLLLDDDQFLLRMPPLAPTRLPPVASQRLTTFVSTAIPIPLIESKAPAEDAEDPTEETIRSNIDRMDAEDVTAIWIAD